MKIKKKERKRNRKFVVSKYLNISYTLTIDIIHIIIIIIIVINICIIVLDKYSIIGAKLLSILNKNNRRLLIKLKWQVFVFL